METSQTRADRTLAATRVLSAIIIPFLVAAFIVLFPEPTDTARLFAWGIKPPMSAMVLGSVYLGGAYFFLRVVRSSNWHTVAGGFLPVATFATLMGIATILHWDRFNHGQLAFWLWVCLYFTTPFLVLAIFFRNQRQYAPATGEELKMPGGAALAIVALGAAAVLTGAFLFVLPQQAGDIWPWQLTPLTARVLGAVFALGLAGLGAWRERRWSAARVLVQVEGFMLLLILVAGVRASSELDPAKPLTWLFAVGFVVTAVASAVLYIRMESRARSVSTSGKQLKAT